MKIEMINIEDGRKKCVTFDDVLRIFSYGKGLKEISDINLSKLRCELLDWEVVKYNKFKFQRIY